MPRDVLLLDGTTQTIGGETFCLQSRHGSAGGEGYVIPVVRLAEGERLMLKCYRLPSPERRQRIEFLSSLNMRQLPGLPAAWFDAAPCMVVGTKVLVPRPKGGQDEVEIEGYLATFIEGRTLEECLADEAWDPTLETRRDLARHLCMAVQILEDADQLVHGDLSGRNILVTHGPRPELRLIDFDGFYHHRVRPILCTKAPGGRGWGSDGYRSPVYRSPDDSMVVTTDRVAMAVLAYELVVRRPGDATLLSRDTFLDQQAIDNMRPTLPQEIVDRWPEGWELVRQAIAANPPDKAPSPERWRAVITDLATLSNAVR